MAENFNMPGKLHFIIKRLVLLVADSFWSKKWDNIFKFNFFQFLVQIFLKMPFFGRFLAKNNPFFLIKMYKVSAIKVGHTLFYCFLLDNTLNFEAFFIKLVCMSIFDIQKYIPKKFLKNCPNLPNSEKWAKIFIYQEKSNF